MEARGTMEGAVPSRNRRAALLVTALLIAAAVAGSAWLALSGRAPVAVALAPAPAPVVVAPVAVAPAPPEAARPPAGPRTLEGTLYDVTDEKPAPGAKVVVYDATDPKAPCDAKGSFLESPESCDDGLAGLWSLIESGKFEVRTVATTRTDKEGHFSVEVEGERLGVHFQLGADEGIDDFIPPPVSEIDFKLEHPGTLEGTVTDGESPLAGAEVAALLKFPPKILRTRTDPQGRFRFQPVAADGNYLVTARAPHHRAAWESCSGSREEPCELELASLSPIAGRVVFKDRRPASGARVVFERKTETVAAADGRFELREVPCQFKCTLVATLPGFQAEQSFGSDQDRTNVELVLAPVGQVRVSVVDQETGAPVDCTLTTSGGTVAREGPGVFLVSEVPQSSGRFLAKAPGYSHEDIRAAVIPGQVVSARIELKRINDAIVEVHGSGGRLLKDAIAYTSRTSGTRVGEDIPSVARHAGEDGRIMLKDVRRGEEIFARHPDYATGSTRFDDPRAGVVVIQLVALGDVRVQVVDPSGAPARGVTVRSMKERDGPRGQPQAQTDAGGRAQLGLAPGSWGVWAHGGGFHRSAVARVEVKADAPSEVRLELRAAQSIKGRVIDHASRPIGGAKVTCSKQSGSDDRFEHWIEFDQRDEGFLTDAQGRFELDELDSSSTYDLWVNPPEGFEHFLTPVAQDAKPGGPPLEIRLSGPGTVKGRLLVDGKPAVSFRIDGQGIAGPSFNLSLAPGKQALRFDGEFARFEKEVEVKGDLETDLGDVRASRGRHLEGRVTLRGAPVADMSLSLLPSALGMSHTNAAGEFLFDLVAPGTYSLVGLGKAACVSNREITVGFEPVSIQLEAQPLTSSLTGRVLRPGGKPLAEARVVMSLGMENLWATTAADGTFHFDALGCGPWKLALGLWPTKDGLFMGEDRIVTLSPGANAADLNVVPWE
jgi:hypothetical protein